MLRRIKQILGVGLVAGLLTVLAVPVLAQGGDVIADGLDNPRGLFYDEAGNLYIAEAGSGGADAAKGPFDSDVMVGGSGRITMVGADGPVAMVQALSSMDGGNVYGTQDVAIRDGLVWIVQGEGAESVPFNMALIGLDAESLRVRHFVDLYTLEAEENPDGDIVASQPTALAFGPDGAIYVANAGCNCIMRWDDMAGASIFASWSIEDNPVPTAVAFGPGGDLYVGFLSGFPFAEGGARIERWTLDGELVTTYDGLTTVTGLTVTDDGTIYAVEHGRFGDTGWVPESGRVVMVAEDGLTPVAEGLTQPYGIAAAPDGSLAVSVNSSAGAGAGQVIRVGGM